MSAFSQIAGDFETEIALPFRVEYRIDAQGDVEVVALIPLCEAMPAEARLKFSALPVHEQRCLRAAAEADAQRREAEAEGERALSAREARAYWKGERWGA